MSPLESPTTEAKPTVRIAIAGSGLSLWLSAWNCLAQGIPAEALTLIELTNTKAFSPQYIATQAEFGQWLRKILPNEPEWMPNCNANYHVAVCYKQWSQLKEHSTFRLNFPSDLDPFVLPLFATTSEIRRQGAKLNLQPDDYLFGSALAKHNFSPRADYCFPFEYHYGYQLDTHALRDELKTKVMQSPIALHTSATLNIHLDAQNITAFALEDQTRISADVYLDLNGLAPSTLSQRKISDDINHCVSLSIERDVSSAKNESTLTRAQHGWIKKLSLAHLDHYDYFCHANEKNKKGIEAELRAVHPKVKRDALSHRTIDSDTTASLSVGKNYLSLPYSSLHFSDLGNTSLDRLAHALDTFNTEYLEKSTPIQQLGGRLQKTQDAHEDFYNAHFIFSKEDKLSYWLKTRERARLKVGDRFKVIANAWLQNTPLVKPEDEDQTKLGELAWINLLSGFGVLPKVHSELADPSEYNGHIKKRDAFFKGSLKNYSPLQDALIRVHSPEEIV